MPTTVRICGVDYPSCERVQDGTYWGIKTPGKTFWLFPVCDDDGREITSLPPFLPLEIRAVTNETPDLTQRYPETINGFFHKRRSYFCEATLQTYVTQYPNECWLTEDQFKREQNRMLAEPLEEFARAPSIRRMVWDRHGTPELANECGYLGNNWETEVLDNGTEHRVLHKASIAQSLVWNLENSRKIGSDAAWAIVNKLRYVICYEDAPKQRWIYLEGMTEAPTTQPPTAILRIETVERTEQRIELVCPDLEQAEKIIAQIPVSAAQLNAAAQAALSADEKRLRKESAIIAAKLKLVAEEARLQADKKQNQKEEAQRACERGKQPVTRPQVRDTLKVKTDRGVLKICARHQAEWPQTQGELDRLAQKHLRHKKGLREKLTRRNKARAEKRRSQS